MAWFDQTMLRGEIVDVAHYIRHELTAQGYDGRFTLNIKIEGSADKADATLKFDFDLSRNYGNHVCSPNLSDAVHELMRRMGFDKVHSAELLTYDAGEAETLAGLQAPRPASPEPQD